MFIDAAVEDSPLLESGVRPGVEIIQLNAQDDGISQISEALAHRHGVSAIHILSHGAPGRVHLGNGMFTVRELNSHVAQLGIIGQALSPDGSILVYGCNVAQGGAGRGFVGRLAELTKAGVAAAAGTTGSAKLGGNWKLAPVAGRPVTVASAVTEKISLWNHTLTLANGLQVFASTATHGTSITSTNQQFKMTATQNGASASVYADPYGAYINDSTTAGGITSYFEVTANGAGGLGSFTLTTATIANYHTTGYNGSSFNNVYAVGYAAGVQVAATTPYNSSGWSASFPIDYTPFAGKSIDTLRVYYTTAAGTPQINFNFQDFSISNAAGPSANANLTNLALSIGTLSPTFASGTTAYTASVSNSVTSITATPTVSDATATVKVNSVAVASGSASGPLTLNVGGNAVTVLVAAQDGSTTKTYTVTVTRAANVTPSFVTAGAGSLTVAQSALATDIKGLLHISDTDGGQTETWSQSVAPSHGSLSFSSATSSSGSSDITPGGTITYTPTASYAGPDTFTVRVSDGTAIATSVINVTVTAPTVTVNPLTLNAMTPGTLFATQSFSATGGYGAYTYTVSAGSLPTGLSLNSSTGALTGTPTAAGAYNFTIRATDSSTGTGAPFSSTLAFSGTVGSSNVAPIFVSAGAGSLTVAQSALATDLKGLLHASDTDSSQTETWSQSVAPSHGSLSFSGATSGSGASDITPGGTITYTPTAGYAGLDTFTVQVNDGTATATRVINVTVTAPTVSVTALTLNTMTVGAVFSSQSFTATGGYGAYTYSVSAGSLPAGLSLNSSTGALTGTPTTAGAYSFTVQATDSSTGTSAPFSGTRAFSGTVNQASTTTAVASGTNPSIFGQSVTFTATVTSSGGMPAGTVTFKDGATTLGTGTLASGSATFSTSALSLNGHTVTAVFGGDTNFATSTSSSLTQNVNQATTTTAVASGTNPSTYGQSVTFTATVTSSGGTPTGTVTFKDGAATLGTGTLNGSGVASYSTSALTLNGHTVSAVYGGDTIFATSTSSSLTQTVNQATTTTAVTSGTNPSTYGQSVTFTATVASSGGTPTGTVTFKDGAATLGTGTLNGSGVATYSSSSLTLNGHTVSAVYGGDTNFATSTSSSLTQTVNQATTTTAVASGTNPSTYGQSVTFAATVTSSGGTPTGTVTFKDGAATLGTGTLASGSATFSTLALSLSGHTVTAVYDEDTNFITSTSASVTQTVNQATTTTAVASGTNPSTYGQLVTFTATVASSGGTPTGTVTFKDGAVTLGTGTLASGSATFSTSALSLSGHTVTAVYGGDTNFTTSTSAPVTQTVNQATTTTAVASGTNPTVYGTPVTFTAIVASSGGTPTGTVTFKDGATTLGTGTLSSGSATYATSSLTAIGHGITAIYGGDTNFSTSTSSLLSQTVNKATPVLTWLAPYPVPGGTILDGRQLNATASVPGTFVYTPAAGATLTAGLGQALSVTFTPTDGTNYNTATTSVTIDGLKTPQLITFAPLAAKILSDPSFNLSAAASSGLTVSYASSNPSVATVSGAAVSIVGVGTTTITASQAGNTSFSAAASVNQALTVGYAASAPSVSVFTLSDGAITSAALLSITGNASGINGIKSVIINGAPLTLGTLNAFSQAFTLTTGENTFTVTAIDNAGLEATDSRTITYDNTRPVITVASPADNSTRSATSVVVTGYLDNAGTLSARVNSGSPQAATMTGNNFSVTLNLSAGSNTIALTAVDLAGNSSTVNRTIVSDTASPSLSVTTPSLDISTDQSTLVLSGTLTDTLSAASLTVTMDGQSYAPVVSAGSFQVSLPLPTAKQYAITVTGVDAAGNSVSVQRNVIRRALPGLSWNNPAAISFGTALGEVQLNASSGVAGSIVYAPNSGTVLNAGKAQVLTATFTPNDLTSYSPATASVVIDVNQAVPVITWANPAPISYGTPLGAAQRNATANVPGALSYAPAAGILNAGAGQTLTATFTPSDTANYATVTKSVSIDVNRSVPVLTWNTPAAISFGTALGAAQLNASATVAGSFLYTPAAGSFPNGGAGRVLSVLFTPTDSLNYTNASTNVALDVNKSAQSISFGALGAKLLTDLPFVIGATSSSALPVTFTSSNNAVATVSGATVSIVGAGTCTITASQAGDSNYVAALGVNQPLTIVYAASVPTVRVSTLSDGAITNAATLNIAGSASGVNGIKTVIINGTPVALDTLNAFTQVFALREGQNTFTTTALDNAGLEATDSRTITLDTSRPVITVTAPADNSTLSATSVVVTGYLDNPGTLTAVVNNGSAHAADMTGNNFSITLNLAGGTNTIELTATDLAGNSSTAKRTVVSDTTKPSLAVTYPGSDSTINATSFTLAGTVSDDLGSSQVSVTMEGITYTPQVLNGAFTQQLSLPSAKTYQITVTAVDQGGNSVTVVRNVIRPRILGDLNHDGKVDIVDALIALQMSVGILTPNADDLAAGDVAPLVNGVPQPDSVIDIEDAYAILKKAVGSLNF